MSGISTINSSQPFQLETAGLRGRLIRMGSVIDQIITRQNYPAPVNNLLSELLVLAASFAGTLKFAGRFSLQVRGHGPIRTMVADCTNDGAMRGYAGFDETQFDGGEGLALFGEAVLAIVVDQSAAGSETYQGIVPLSAKGLTASIREYFWQSEQVPTGITLALNENDGHLGWHGAALIVQSLPQEGDDDPHQGIDHREVEADDDWRRIMLLMGTIDDNELLDASDIEHRLLWRLFHEDGIRVFEPLMLSAGCRCSAKKVQEMLDTFSADELAETITADGEILVTCQFCGEEYRYQQAQVDTMMQSRSDA